MPNLTTNQNGDIVCQNTQCNSDRIIEICAKHSDCLSVQYHDAEHDGYNCIDLKNLDSEGSDYIYMNYCLECGQIQGEWPAPEPTDLY